MNKKQKRHNLKYSIRTQFAIIFIVVMMITIGAYWIINSLFLQRYYILDKQDKLMRAYEDVDSLVSSYDTSDKDFRRLFLQLCSSFNLNAAIVTPGLQTVISTTGNDNIMIMRLFEHVFDVDDNIFGNLIASENGINAGSGPEGNRKRKGFEPIILYENENYEICIAVDPRMGIDYLELWGTLSGGDIIIMRTALNSIRESVSVSNRFLGYVGFVMVLLSAVIIWFVTKRITRPIGELAKLSERMTSLDFEAKYVSGGRNEIDVLGEHMNELSETLEKTISELKTSNNELKRDIEKKEKQDSMRQEFLSNVAHELKTPIALVQGYAEGLKDDIAESREDRDYYCDVIIDEAGKMNRLVKNLMTLNELEFGDDKISLERFDLTNLVKGCIQANDLLIRQNDITLDFNVDTQVFVWSDEFKTEQVITNYLSNAIHYCSEPADNSGGGKRIVIRFKEGDGVVRVQVFNTGEPVPEDSLPHLFEKFYKVDKARTREYGGSGVGLSIVKAIMDALNKDYGVENHSNGVTFWFELDCSSRTGDNYS